MGLLRPEQSLTDEEALQLVLEPGFSTADRLTQQAGRGVGMDVVATEVKNSAAACSSNRSRATARASRSACRSRWRSRRR